MNNMGNWERHIEVVEELRNLADEWGWIIANDEHDPHAFVATTHTTRDRTDLHVGLEDNGDLRIQRVTSSEVGRTRLIGHAFIEGTI
jgi:hypothetical protein